MPTRTFSELSPLKRPRCRQQADEQSNGEGRGRTWPVSGPTSIRLKFVFGNLSWHSRWRRYREFMRYCSRVIVAAILFAVTPLGFAATPSADEVLAKARTAAAAAPKKIFLRFDASW